MDGANAEMDERKKRRLEEAGWAVEGAEDFLGLSEEEAAYVAMKLALSRALRERRMDLGLTQASVAKRLGSSQSRVAKMEASDAAVSVDLLVRGLLACGATRREIASVIDGSTSTVET